jgi:hypothetical protein
MWLVAWSLLTLELWGTFAAVVHGIAKGVHRLIERWCAWDEEWGERMALVCALLVLIGALLGTAIRLSGIEW